MNLPDQAPDDLTAAAVSLFWTGRNDQIASLANGGLVGEGARTAGHMDGIRDLVKGIFLDAGMPADSVIYGPYLPGAYRPRKRWDMAVRYKGTLVAALQFRSQAGNIAKKINNRFEEALSTATDTQAAHGKLRTFGEAPLWLGYVLVLREDDETAYPNRSLGTLLPADPAFAGMSYSQRYQQMLGRFIGDRIYEAGWFITTKIDGAGRVSYGEPLAIASGKVFRTAVQGRVNNARIVLDRQATGRQVIRGIWLASGDGG